MSGFFLQYAPILYLIQLVFAIIIGLYFWNLLKNQLVSRQSVIRESEKETKKLSGMRNTRLTEPLSSLTRPADMTDVVGQKEGIELLRAALCGLYPQHIIIYGPPGVGKTAAARLVLEEAKKNDKSPFDADSQFVEVDATITRFDERNIADPLIGSVHDPIYQGAGSMGQQGVPQPKPGACTKAHGGILFIDEIGELHPMQMNKLLKVLEDRKVLLESAYYSANDKNIPAHIHDVFQNGLPADFRLVGATTRMPSELPPALRSRCMEVFFNPLDKENIRAIAANAAQKLNINMDEDAMQEIIKYSSNGRETVNIIQLGAGIAQSEDLSRISLSIVEKVLNNGRFSPRSEVKLRNKPVIGVVNGLAVHGAGVGMLIELECRVISVTEGTGSWNVTGVVEKEQVGGGDRTLTRKSMARGAVENMLTVLRADYNVATANYDIHLNFPGGIPVDGPSAGIAMATAVYSAVNEKPVYHLLAMTGEISIQGKVKPVGGVMSKVDAARKAGCKKIIIPQENWLSVFKEYPDVDIIPVSELSDVFNHAFC